MREASLELSQLALWLQMLSRAETPPSADQILLIASRIEAGLHRVKVLRAMGGEGESPDE